MREITINIKPNNGLLVRDPITRKPLLEAGEMKPRSIYWLRRIADKSVTEITISLEKKVKQDTDKSVIEIKVAPKTQVNKGTDKSMTEIKVAPDTRVKKETRS